jgi:hypothetical protein
MSEFEGKAEDIYSCGVLLTLDPKPTFRNARILAANFRPPRTNFNPKLEHDYRLFTTLPPKMRST